MNYVEYAVGLRRELHRFPEIGFDLPKTLAIVRRELEAMGIGYTEQFGKSSIVATINGEKNGFTFGLRADMDALPITECANVPFPSEHSGCMHACGHDIHTAMLLAVARQLQNRKDELPCRVKLLFTPAEEYSTPGCQLMAEDGVMEDIDCIVATHVEPNLKVGSIAADAGGQGANSMGFTIDFFGTSAHAARQNMGHDAIGMAVEAYQALHWMVAKEIDPVQPRLLNIGSIHGGNTNNIICDNCKMFVSARTHSDSVSQYIFDRAVEICQGIAAMKGGSARVEITKFLPYVENHPVVTEKIRQAAAKIVGQSNIVTRPRSMGGEDFSFLSRIKPGMQFRIGTQNDDPDTARALHNDHIVFDERCLQIGIDVMVQFVLDNKDGIRL